MGRRGAEWSGTLRCRGGGTGTLRGVSGETTGLEAMCGTPGWLRTAHRLSWEVIYAQMITGEETGRSEARPTSHLEPWG